MPTIIRHKSTDEGFAVVVTDFETDFTARFQRYSYGLRDALELEEQHSFSSEQPAIEMWEAYESQE